MLYFTTMTQPQLAISSSILADKTQQQNKDTFNEQFTYETPSVVSSGTAQLDKRNSVNELSIEKLKELYLETLTPKEYKSYIIARDHLGMSFTLEKSVGFLQWKKEFIKT
jgi:hypothetical protein